MIMLNADQLTTMWIDPTLKPIVRRMFEATPWPMASLASGSHIFDRWHGNEYIFPLGTGHEPYNGESTWEAKLTNVGASKQN